MSRPGFTQDNLVSTLTRLELKFLELTFDSRDLDPASRPQNIFYWMMSRRRGMSESPNHSPAPLTPAEVSLNCLDVDALMTRLESISSLEAALVVLHGSRPGVENFERSIEKGSSRLAGLEQWHSWLPGKTPFVQARLYFSSCQTLFAESSVESARRSCFEFCCMTCSPLKFGEVPRLHYVAGNPTKGRLLEGALHMLPINAFYTT